MREGLGLVQHLAFRRVGNRGQLRRVCRYGLVWQEFSLRLEHVSIVGVRPPSVLIFTVHLVRRHTNTNPNPPVNIVKGTAASFAITCSKKSFAFAIFKPLMEFVTSRQTLKCTRRCDPRAFEVSFDASGSYAYLTILILREKAKR